jgi:hypothetical protein
MEMKSQLEVPDALFLSWMKGWMCPRAGLDDYIN